MFWRLASAASLLWMALAGWDPARAGLGFELFGGAPLNLKTPLRISQAGFPELEFDGEYRTRPLRVPLYWALRASLGGPRGRWGLMLVHHKLYLRGGPPEIQTFSVSHGLNLVTLEREWPLRAAGLHAGLGFVVAHPENTVRGQRLDQSEGFLGAGYYLTGPVAALAAGRRIPLGRAFSLGLELRVTLARARVPVAGGHARLTSAALHLLAGLGWSP
jgi:hypothetical protein